MQKKLLIFELNLKIFVILKLGTKKLYYKVDDIIKTFVIQSNTGIETKFLQFNYIVSKNASPTERQS